MFNQLPDPLNGAALDAARVPPQAGYDVYPDVLYSTMVIPQAGQPVGVPVAFFQGAETTPSDRTLTNVPQGTIPGGQKFHVLATFCVPLVETTVTDATDATGLSRDVDRVFKTNRPFWNYAQPSISRTRGPFPLDAVGEQGAILPDFGGNNAPAATHGAVYQHARTGAIGGWPMSLIIFETELFPLNLVFGVQNALTAPMTLVWRHYGWRYVKIG